MGLFGFVKKAVGKIARTGLSAVTGGASEKIIKTAKSLGLGKKRSVQAKGGNVTEQMKASVAKISPTMAPTPVLEKMGVGIRGGLMKTPRRKTTRAKSKRKTTRRKTTSSWDIDTASDRPGGARPRAKRTAPKGGLDLKKIGVMYRASGRTDWRQFIKENSNVRK